MHKKIIAMIPARYEASRFPGKLLKVLEGKSIIARTYEAVLDSKLFDEVYVVADHTAIQEELERIGGRVIMSTKQHESGTDRIAEAVEQLPCDIVINVQGDEPFISREALQKVIDLFQNKEVQIASLMMPIDDEEKIQNPNCVKVVVDRQCKALYFSRSPIPYLRDQTEPVQYFQHIGVYGYKKETLLQITKLVQSPLEKIEKLENLRMLENGLEIFLDTVQEIGIAIDTPEDFIKAQQYLAQKK
ncbi:MAG: 3-deoxy-manno-octulosonate cytidylyltransferase [Bacteroidetes bacterium]|nr:3-deoxy-manno-octulosonate cytidylyltransferase [Bacteroidota bacterium]